MLFDDSRIKASPLKFIIGVSFSVATFNTFSWQQINELGCK